MEVQGAIKLIDDTQEFGSNGFRKRSTVIVTDEQYEQEIQVEFVQDKCSLLDAYEAGQEVKIGINLRGRCWTNPQGEDKYFVSLNGWRIEAIEGGGRQDSAVDAHEAKVMKGEEEEDDLPF